MTKNIHYFGIRHHGVKSAKRLVSALEVLRPTKVLIEGASDCTELISWLNHPKMTPPVALLAYANEVPECHFYYPFAKFSPEYQACLWALNHGVSVAFIDLPVSVTLAHKIDHMEEQTSSEASAHSDDGSDERLSTDPIGVMGALLGYDDGESFWNDVIEQSGDDEGVFDAIGQMMQALRQEMLDKGMTDDNDELREAFMRQEIRRHLKDLSDDDCVVVVCGAWHIPALDDKFALYHDGKKITHSAKSDNTRLKFLPKKLPASKLKTTWIPYTSPRLAKVGQGSVYGAGVSAPMWYQHLWDNDGSVHESWLTKIADALRQKGHIVSTASVIEAVRLADGLAKVRNRRVGFLELTDAVVACLCFGETVLWQTIADEILLGKEVGQIPDELPLAPLLEDLERLKKHTKLKAEAVPKEVDFDLRSEIGLKKSHLLHRLAILGVAWGRLQSTGSRGTFRERWEICWEPEFAVSLIENLVYGNTIFEASTNCLNEKIQRTQALPDLATLVQQALEAGLESSALIGIRQLSLQAVHTDNVLTLLMSLSPLIHLSRYGTARQMALEQVDQLVAQMSVKVCVGLPYATRRINDDEAGEYHQYLSKTHQALMLTQDENLLSLWWQALLEVIDGALLDLNRHHLRVVGLLLRLMYQGGQLQDERLLGAFYKILSPVVPVGQSAQFFEGFFDGAIHELLHHKALLQCLETWFLSLDETAFIEHLPLFCRVFGSLDGHEKKRLWQSITQQTMSDDVFLYREELAPIWQAHLNEMIKILA